MQTQKKAILVYVELGLHEKIRCYVFDHRMTVAQFVREAIESKLETVTDSIAEKEAK